MAGNRELSFVAVLLVAAAAAVVTPGPVEAQGYPGTTLVDLYCGPGADPNETWWPYFHGTQLWTDSETCQANIDDPNDPTLDYCGWDDYTYVGKPSTFVDIASGYWPGGPADPNARSYKACNPTVPCGGTPCPSNPNQPAFCGPGGSLEWYYNEGTDPNTYTDDYLCFRMRVEATPVDSAGTELANAQWNFLIDVGQDPNAPAPGAGGTALNGWKDFWVALNGRVDGNVTGYKVWAEDNNSQQITTTTANVTRIQDTAGYDYWDAEEVTAYWTNPQNKNDPPSTHEWFVGVVVPVIDFWLPDPANPTNHIQMVLGRSTPMQFFISTGTSNTNPLQTDCVADCCSATVPCTGNQTTPVTLASFRSDPVPGGWRVTWTTATETANLGFDLYADLEGGRRKVNGELIQSSAGDSLVPQSYSVVVPFEDVKSFQLLDLATNRARRLYGDFEAGRSYGQEPTLEPVEWAAIQGEHRRLLAARTEALRLAMPDRLAASRQPVGDGATALLQPLADLGVEAEGLYRVTYEQLAAAGLDLQGADLGSIAVTNRGIPVPIRVESALRGVFGPGSFIELYATGLDTLYTRTNVYRLWLDPSLALRVKVDAGLVAGGAPPEAYAERLEVERDRAYSFTAPGGDPWYDTRMLVFKTPGSWSFPFMVDNLQEEEATLEVELWGWTDFESTPDHHVQVLVNGAQVADELFDGTVNQVVSATLPPGLLREGENTLQVRLPADTGVDYDLVALEKFSVTYPRALAARDGRLVFDSGARTLSVGGLPSPDVVVYRVEGRDVTRVSRLRVMPGNGYTVTFGGGLGRTARHLVSTVGALRTPSVTLVPEWADLYGSEAEYLVISHPDFIAGLKPLLEARRDQGLTVAVVDVEQLYSQLGHGIFDPQPVKDYIAQAADRLGTRAVLLVGGDTYDYQDILQLGSISFVPTPYAATHPAVSFSPADPLLADLDDDGVQDLAIGRFPVRTVTELESVIAKTLAYPVAGHAGSAVFVADDVDEGLSYAGYSEQLVDRIGPTWNVDRIYIDELGAAEARSRLLDALNAGPALVDFFGHSAPSVWTFDGLLNANDAAALTNAGRPSVVAQWGCWNTYYVEPRYNALGQKLLLSGDRGAAAVLGSASLTEARSDEAIGPLVMENLVEPGMPAGQAILDAKQAMKAAGGEAWDVVSGFVLLGDPMLVLRP